MHINRDQGFALISVLWGVAIMALLCAAILAISSANKIDTHIILQRAQAEAGAEAGINDAIAALLSSKKASMPRIDGVAYPFEWQGAEVTISIQDEFGKVDINNADGASLKRLFVAAGVDPDAAVALADKVMDWREKGIGKRLNGATTEDYRTAGFDYGPRRKPFQSIDELKLVMGMPPRIFDTVASAITVYSHRAYVNPSTAPRLALLAAGLANKDNVDQYIKHRSQLTSSASAAIAGGVLSPSVALANWAFTISASVKMPSGGRYERVAVVRFTGNHEKPYWIQSWREGMGE